MGVSHQESGSFGQTVNESNYGKTT